MYKFGVRRHLKLSLYLAPPFDFGEENLSRLADDALEFFPSCSFIRPVRVKPKRGALFIKAPLSF